MKQSFNFVKNNLKLFFLHPLYNSKFIIYANIIIVYLLVPMVSKIGRFLIDQSGINNLAYDTVLTLILANPFLMLALLCLGFLVLLFIYLEFHFIIMAMFYLRVNRTISFMALLRNTILSAFNTTPYKVLFTFFYILVLAPIGGLGYTTDLIAKVRIPQFVIDFIVQTHPLITISIALVYLALLYLAIRMVLALPLMMLEQYSIKKAVKTSLEYTKNKLWFYLSRYLMISVILGLFLFLLYMFLLIIQVLFDSFVPSIAQYISFVIILLLEGINYAHWILAVYLAFSVFFDQLLKNRLLSYPVTTLTPQKATQKLRLENLVLGAILIVALTSLFSFNSAYLQNVLLKKPIVISHKGHDEYIGVENTIQSLANTIKHKPDYVEMDIQQTKDKQFVVSHDDNLNTLANINKKIYDMNLDSLKQVTLKQNQYETKMSSFDDYLAYANQHHQKLLVELKINEYTKADYVDNFLTKYAKDLIKHGHIIHTLDYDAVQKIKLLHPDLKVGYIMVYNFMGVPRSKADFYSAEYSTLSDNFVSSVHLQNKQTFAWTVNDTEIMANLMFKGVDGIISDQVDDLEATIKDYKNDNDYATKILNFILGKST